MRFYAFVYQLSFITNATKEIAEFADDVQHECTETVFNKEQGMSYLYSTSFFGYKTNDLRKKALKLASNNPKLNNNKILIGEYKEGRSIINLVKESKQAFLFYESL